VWIRWVALVFTPLARAIGDRSLEVVPDARRHEEDDAVLGRQEGGLIRHP
jgi:hypothetical protein